LGYRPSQAMLKTFCKFEKISLDKAPRVIQPRSPEYNLQLGRYIKRVEKRICRKIGKVFGDGPTVMKGYNAQQVARIIRAKWNSFANPVGIGLDAKKFDMHVSVPALQWEHSIYTSMFPGDKFLPMLLRDQLTNFGTAFCDDGVVDFKITGTRCSGDMNTGLGNCVLMCGGIWTWAQQRGVHVKLVNNGDDCVVFLEQEDVAKFTDGLDEFFRLLGFRMTVEKPVDSLHQVEFCQSRVGFNGIDFVMVRNLVSTLQKDSMCLLPIQNHNVLRKWMNAVATGGLSLCAGVPVLQAFYTMFLRNAGAVKFGGMYRHMMANRGTRFMDFGQPPKARAVSPDSRVVFWECFGIDPELQVALEKYYDGHCIDLNSIVPFEFLGSTAIDSRNFIEFETRDPFD